MIPTPTLFLQLSTLLKPRTSITIEFSLSHSGAAAAAERATEAGKRDMQYLVSTNYDGRRSRVQASACLPMPDLAHWLVVLNLVDTVSHAISTTATRRQRTRSWRRSHNTQVDILPLHAVSQLCSRHCNFHKRHVSRWPTATPTLSIPTQPDAHDKGGDDVSLQIFITAFTQSVKTVWDNISHINAVPETGCRHAA
jgi:hypothetical protein